MDDYGIMLQREIDDIRARVIEQEDFCLTCSEDDSDSSTINDDSTIEDLLNS